MWISTSSELPSRVLKRENRGARVGKLCIHDRACAQYLNIFRVRTDFKTFLRTGSEHQVQPIFKPYFWRTIHASLKLPNAMLIVFTKVFNVSEGPLFHIT